MKTFGLLLCLLCSTFAQGTKSLPATAPDEKIDAAALLKEVIGKAPKTPQQMMGSLKIRDAQGYREVPIQMMTRIEGAAWYDIYQTPKSGSIPQEVLVVKHHEGSTNRYEFHREGKPIPNIETNLFVPFGTSDFWLADFGLEFLHWPNPKHLRTEMRKHRPCYVIETTNPQPERGGYGKVVSWIDTEHGGLIRADGYTKDGKLLKEFQLKGFKRVEGGWRLKEVTMRNDQTDSTTRLEFDLEIKE